MAYGRTAEPEEWEMVDSDEREALVGMIVQNATDAERRYGMPAEDCRRAMRHMTSKHLKEVEMAGEGDCLFSAVKSAVRSSGLEMSAEQLRERVAVEVQDGSTAMPGYANGMLRAGTWGADGGILQIAAVIRRQVTVVVMRPRKGEEVVQVYTPRHHDGDITIMHRPGQFTEMSKWRLNEQGRRCTRRAAVALFGLRMAREMTHRMRIWRRRQLRSALELRDGTARSTVYNGDWEVVDGMVG